jgi:hypothetical protein
VAIRSFLADRIEAQFTALRYFTLEDTDHAYDERLRGIADRANVA